MRFLNLSGGQYHIAKAGDEAGRARRVRHVRSAFSFDSNTLSIDAIRPDPTVDASTIIANLESVALPGFDEMNVLAAVHLA